MGPLEREVVALMDSEPLYDLTGQIISGTAPISQQEAAEGISTLKATATGQRRAIRLLAQRIEAGLERN